MYLFIINDTHIGVQRSAGTTPVTAWNLRQSVLAQFGRLVGSADRDLMILGDLFDAGSIPRADFLATFEILHRWLSSTPLTLFLVAGNHDLPKTSTNLSDFQLLGKLLESLHQNVEVIEQPTLTSHGYVIPHLPNQDLFDQALANVPPCDVAYMHCNFDNNFAAQSDQSLNLSAEQAAACPAKSIVIAHEHQTRRVGKVWIPGNQIVTSVADCLGSKVKQFTVVEGGQPRFERLLDIPDVFLELPWTDLSEVPQPFIRVTGTVPAESAGDVVSAISSYRKASSAFVITNAVKILAEDGKEVFARSLESIKAFDVMAALKEFLSAEEFAVVARLK